MTKPFLRSGNLDKLVALGENGQPIYAQAQSIREALRLKNQQAIADCLAIPQLNAQQDRIDWYAPFSGDIRPWAAVDEDQRRAALAKLDACRADVEALSRQAAAAPQAAQQRFGILLRYLLRFPDAQQVYLIDGKPVLTFWGFSRAEQSSDDDPFACLRSADIPPVAAPVIAAETVISTPSEPQNSLPPPRTGRKRWLPLPIVAVVMTLAALGWQWRQPPAAAPQAAAPKPVSPAPPAIHPIPPLPLAKATLLPTPLPAPTPAAPPGDGNALSMPAASVKAGSTRFLNGEWRAVPDIKTPLTGRLPSLHYRLHNGKGGVSLRQADNVRCQVAVETGLMPSGNLVINSRSKARCSDGSRYQIPEIVCQPQEDRPAACSGRYGADTFYPMTITREKK